MIIAGTGHRPNKLGGYNALAYLKLLKIATEYLEETKPELVISGMAQGWDMALAQAAIKLQIPFNAYIPFEGQELIWPQATQLYYRELLKAANQIRLCSPGGFTDKVMRVRNRAMVDDCDFLVALWNGSAGGTENCLNYAIRIGKPYINLWEKYAASTEQERS